MTWVLGKQGQHVVEKPTNVPIPKMDVCLKLHHGITGLLDFFEVHIFETILFIEGYTVLHIICVHYTLQEPTYPTWRKGKLSSKVPFWGEHVSSQEGKIHNYTYYYIFLSICMSVSTSHIPISSEIPGFLHSKFLSTWMSKPCLLSPNPGQRSTSTHGKSSWLVFVCKNSAKGAGVSCETELMNGETWIRRPCVDRQRNR